MTPREKLELLRSYKAAGGTGSYVSLLKEAKEYFNGGPKSKPMLPYSTEALKSSGTPVFYQAPVSPLYPNQYSKQPAKQEIKRYNKEDLPLYAKAVSTVFGSIDKEVDRSIGLYNTLVDFKNNRIDDKMSDEEVKYREKLVNAQHYGYPTDLKSIGRFLDRVDNGEMQGNSIGKKNEESVFLRRQLASKYYGLPYDTTSIIKSKYKPSISKNPNAEYYDFSPKIKEDYINALKNKKDPIGYIEELKDINSIKRSRKEYSNRMRELVKKYGTSELSAAKDPFKQQLGVYKTSTGKDDRGRYISIYDEWDIDPPILKNIGIDVDKLNYPFEFYTRIYEDELIDKTKNK